MESCKTISKKSDLSSENDRTQYGLSTEAQQVFSEKYILTRERFLKEYFFSGQTADSRGENIVKFSDQTISMGQALTFFATEALTLKAKGINASASDAAIRVLLEEFNELESSPLEEKIYGGKQATGFFFRDTVHRENRKGIPNSWQIVSDMDSTLFTPGTDKSHAALSNDQIINLFFGWWAVVNWTSDQSNIALARRHTRTVIDYLIRMDFFLALPDGGTIASHRGPDLRLSSGYFVEMASKIIGEDFWKLAEVRMLDNPEDLELELPGGIKVPVPGRKISPKIPVRVLHNALMNQQDSIVELLSREKIDVRIKLSDLFPQSPSSIELPLPGGSKTKIDLAKLSKTFSVSGIKPYSRRLLMTFLAFQSDISESGFADVAQVNEEYLWLLYRAAIQGPNSSASRYVRESPIRAKIQLQFESYKGIDSSSGNLGDDNGLYYLSMSNLLGLVESGSLKNNPTPSLMNGRFGAVFVIKDGSLYCAAVDSATPASRAISVGSWNGTSSMAVLNEDLYIIQNNRIHRVHRVTGEWTEIGAPEWGGQTFLESIDNSLYVLQNSTLHRVDPETGAYTVLGGSDWKGATAMTALKGRIYLIQNRRIHRVDPQTGQWTVIGQDSWSGPAYMVGLGDRLFVIQNNRLHAVNPVDGTWNLLGNDDWSGATGLVSVQGLLYAIRNQTMYRVDPGTGSYEVLVGDDWGRAPVMSGYHGQCN
jgi:hypothetical protein